jgi:GNAT superfamily N-acetyltransferase
LNLSFIWPFRHNPGYLKVNFGEAQTEITEGNSLEIHRIYVLQNFHGKNVGQLLLDTAKNWSN